MSSEKKKVSALEFTRIFHSEDTIDSYQCHEEIYLDTFGDEIIRKVIKNCEFKLLEVQDSNISSLRFINCTSNNISVESTISDSTIVFDNCIIIGVQIHCKDKITIDRIILKNQTQIEHIAIEANCNSISIGNSTFKDLKYFGPAISGNLHQVKISRSVFEKVSIEGAAGTSINLASLEQGHVEIIDCKISNVQTLNTNNIKLVLHNCETKQVLLYSGKNIALTLFDLTTNLVLVENVNFKTLGLRGKCKISNFYGIGDEIRCDDLILTSVTIQEESSIVFNKFDFKRIEIAYLSNNGQVRFDLCKIEEELLIYKSNLGRTIFNNISLDKSQKVYLADNDISEVIFLNFIWSNDYTLHENWDVNYHKLFKDHLLSLRETYRQLKNNYNANGNRIESLEFQKHELRMHYEITKNDFKQNISNKKSWFPRLGNFLILWTHKQASDFGQNVLRPVGLLILFHSILFALFRMDCNLGYKFSTDPTWEATFKAIGDFLYTLLPTHGQTLKTFQGETVEIPLAIDVLIRIFSGYFIFYFITASRKYHQ